MNSKKYKKIIESIYGFNEKGFKEQIKLLTQTKYFEKEEKMNSKKNKTLMVRPYYQCRTQNSPPKNIEITEIYFEDKNLIAGQCAKIQINFEKREVKLLDKNDQPIEFFRKKINIKKIKNEKT